MNMRQGAIDILRRITAPARRITAPISMAVPIDKWPAALGRLHEVAVPRGVIPQPEPRPSGRANINILFELLDRTAGVEGAVAECGVFRGRTLASMALRLRQTGSTKRVYGFDSFQGFGHSIEYDLEIPTEAADPTKHSGGFSNTSYQLVAQKLKLLGLANVQLKPGFFETSLLTCAETKFSFVHLDCDGYAPYLACLRHFYPLMAADGIIALDEYNDPPWPGCNRAVDEFLADKPEQVHEIRSDNYIKFYFRKL